MNESILTNVGISLPNDFPAVSYEKIYSSIRKKREINEFVWGQYAGAWNAIAYRFLTCTDSDYLFTKLLAEYGTSPPPFQRFQQEREIYIFFVAGLSTIESFCYAAFMVGSFLKAGDFCVQSNDPKETKKYLTKISPEFCAKQYEKAFPLEKITEQFKNLVKDNNYKTWSTIRNILAHREAPNRKYYLSLPLKNLGQGEPVKWIEEISIDINTTRIKRKWLSDKMKELIEEMSEFTQKYLFTI